MECASGKDGGETKQVSIILFFQLTCFGSRPCAIFLITGMKLLAWALVSTHKQKCAAHRFNLLARLRWQGRAGSSVGRAGDLRGRHFNATYHCFNGHFFFLTEGQLKRKIYLVAMGCFKLEAYRNREEHSFMGVWKKSDQEKEVANYYPFGLTFNSYTRENSVPNRWKFQSQEHIDDLGLNWDSFKWRNSMPDIGRFFNVDPLAEKYYYNSPYAFSENKVVAHREIEGLEAEWAVGELAQQVSQNPNGGVAIASGLALGAGNVLGGAISGVANAVMHPLQTLEGIASLSTMEGQVNAGLNLVSEGAAKVDQFQNGTNFDKAVVVGEVVTTVALTVGTGGEGAAAKVSEAGNLTKTVGRIEGLAPKVGSAGGPGAGKAFSTVVKDVARTEANNKCTFCGTNTTRTAGGTQSNIDHAIPKSRGGNNTMNNAQNTCRTCNQQKGTMTTQEYLKKKEN